ncbi:hypothetical protein CT19431_190012 [Cupriavidus taiwanensis]|nr:hypothetical protein CT19431_190012 [Cupriavidus taiwanensis]
MAQAPSCAAGPTRQTGANPLFRQGFRHAAVRRKQGLQYNRPLLNDSRTVPVRSRKRSPP